MTTILGIKAEEQKPGVILASDLARTTTEWKAQGDVAYRRQTKADGQKIFISDNRDFAVCMTGVYDQPYVDFLTSLVKGKIDLEKAVAEGFLPQIRDLTLSRFGGYMPDPNNINSLLVASRFKNNPTLSTIYPLGKVIPLSYSSIGSGSEYALEKIRSYEKLIPGYISLDKAIKLASDSLESATRDIYTGGFDLVVVEADKISSFGKDIDEAVKSAKNEMIRKIQEQIK